MSIQEKLEEKVAYHVRRLGKEEVRPCLKRARSPSHALRELGRLDPPDRDTVHQILNLCHKEGGNFPSAMEYNTKEKAEKMLADLKGGDLL